MLSFCLRQVLMVVPKRRENGRTQPDGRCARLHLQHLFAEGEGDRFRTAGDAELGEEAREVSLDGVGRDAELRGDVVVRESAGNGLENLALAPGQFGNGERFGG